MKNTKKWIKEIALVFLLIVEGVLTFSGFSNEWSNEIIIGLIFADVLTVFNGIMALIEKWDNETIHIIEKEHDEIKGALELYKDLERMKYITQFEGEYIDKQKKQNAEIWIVSNCVAEPDAVLKRIYGNLKKGVSYYYVIPNSESHELDLKKAFDRLCKLNKSSTAPISIKYIKDDLFDFIPTDIVDILFYCNPSSTDYKTNMKVFYSFQKDYGEEPFYKPANLEQIRIRHFFDKMCNWKKSKCWNELNSNK